MPLDVGFEDFWICGFLVFGVSSFLVFLVLLVFLVFLVSGGILYIKKLQFHYENGWLKSDGLPRRNHVFLIELQFLYVKGTSRN